MGSDAESCMRKGFLIYEEILFSFLSVSIRGFPASNILRFYTHKLQTIYIQQLYERLHNTFIYQHLSDLLAVHTFLCNLFVYDCRVFFTKYAKKKSREAIPLNLTCRERNKAPDAVGVQTDEHQRSSNDKTGDPCNHNCNYLYSNNGCCYITVDPGTPAS